MAEHFGQPHVASTKAKGALRVLDPQKVKHRGVQIMNFISVFHSPVAEFIGCSNGAARFDSTSGKPSGAPKGVVVTTIGTLSEGGPSEFSGPYDQSFVQHTQFAKITYKSGDRLIHGFAILPMTVNQPSMLIPPIAIAPGTGQFDDPTPSLHQPSGQKALHPKGSGDLEIGIHPV